MAEDVVEDVVEDAVALQDVEKVVLPINDRVMESVAVVDVGVLLADPQSMSLLLSHEELVQVARRWTSRSGNTMVSHKVGVASEARSGEMGVVGRVYILVCVTPFV